jgi:hypothetical protein
MIADFIGMLLLIIFRILKSTDFYNSFEIHIKGWVLPFLIIILANTLIE